MKLRTAGIPGKQQFGMAWSPHYGTNGLFEKRKLVSCSVGHINAVNLAHFRKASADVQALPVFGPVQDTG